MFKFLWHPWNVSTAPLLGTTVLDEWLSDWLLTFWLNVWQIDLLAE
jgi:hypothetical protein